MVIEIKCRRLLKEKSWFWDFFLNLNDGKKNPFSGLCGKMVARPGGPWYWINRYLLCRDLAGFCLSFLISFAKLQMWIDFLNILCHLQTVNHYKVVKTWGGTCTAINCDNTVIIPDGPSIHTKNVPVLVESVVSDNFETSSTMTPSYEHIGPILDDRLKEKKSWKTWKGVHCIYFRVCLYVCL